MTPKAKILVVDDEAGTRDILQQILRDMGYDVQTVASGYNAIEMIKEDKFDVVITDIRMPGVDGLSVLEVAKGIDPEIEVIMITAYASLESSIEALRDGAANYIMKPVNIEELKAALRNALGRQRLARENKGLLKNLKEAKEESDRWAYAVGVLYRLSEDLRSQHDFKEIAGIALNHLSQVVDFHLGAVLLLTGNGGKVVVRVNPGADTSHIDEVTSILLKEINDLTQREVKAEDLIVEAINPVKDKTPKESDLSLTKVSNGVKASLTLPLTFNEVVIGGINVASLEKETFQEVDQKTIYAVASHIALAIEGHKR